MSWSELDLAFKTLLNRRVTDDNKFYYNEFEDVTINIHLLEVWSQFIDPDPAQAIIDGTVEKKTLFALTEDITVPDQQCWYAEQTGNRLKDWVSTKYGLDYHIHLFDGSNVEIFPTDNVQWLWNPPTGIIIFNGDTSPFTKPFKVTAYRYIGSKGAAGGDVILTGSVDPNGTVTGNFGQTYRDTAHGIWYRCESNPTGMVWSVI